MALLSSAFDTTNDWSKQRGLKIKAVHETGSTNDDAKSQAMAEDEDFVLYLTEHQTAGRGRGTNNWFDTGAGESLLTTWSFHVASSPQAITGPRVGLALFRAASTTWPSQAWSLKAPNDLLLNGNKVAGLLVESVSGGAKFRLLVGLGLNVLNHPRKFTAATHISEALHAAPDVGEWFQFLDEAKAQLQLAAHECQNSTLSPAVCAELTQALNANPLKPFAVQSVSPQGDLLHAGGKVRWTDL